MKCFIVIIGILLISSIIATQISVSGQNSLSAAQAKNKSNATAAKKAFYEAAPAKNKSNATAAKKAFYEAAPAKNKSNVTAAKKAVFLETVKAKKHKKSHSNLRKHHNKNNRHH